jgi:hypothetical protein
MQPEKKTTLDHLYSPHRDAYKALSHTPFGKSDHNYILLIPANKQKLKQELPMTRSIRKWSDDINAKLQDCFASTYWNMFPGTHQMAVRSITHQSSTVTYPNQKPWIRSYIHTELKSRAATFKEWDSNRDIYKKSR